MALLNYGKRVLGFSRCQQQLGFGRYLSSKTSDHHNRYLRTSVNPDNNTNSESEFQPTASLSSKGFSMTNFFRKFFSQAVPPKPTPAQVMVGNIMEAVEKMNYDPQENPPAEEIRLLFRELLEKLTGPSLVNVLQEASKIAVSPRSYFFPSMYSGGGSLKDLVYNIPDHIMPLFLEVMVDVVKEKYRSLVDQDARVLMKPHQICITVDLSDVAEERLKVFLIGDLVVVCGISKHADHPYRCQPTITKLASIPPLPFKYLHDEVTALVIQSHIIIVFRRRVEESVVGKVPGGVYNLKLDRKNDLYPRSKFAYLEEDEDAKYVSVPSSEDSSGMTAGNNKGTDI